jgi:ABC-2 type transport system permease protein
MQRPIVYNIQKLTNWRWSWRSMVTVATLAPLFSIVALGVFGRDSGPNGLVYFLLVGRFIDWRHQ